MKKLRVGIIGQGRSGRNIHVQALKRLPELYEIVAVAEWQDFRRDKAREEIGCDVYEDYLEMAKRDDIDLFVNSTYSDEHMPVSIELLKRNRNVLSEKPAGNSLAMLEEVKKAQAASTGRYTVFQNCRYYSTYCKVLELVRSGILGRLTAIHMFENRFGRRWDWQMMQEHLGGELLNKAVHQLDQTLFMLGPDYDPEVSCVMENYTGIGDAEEYMMLSLRQRGYPVVDIECSIFDAFHPYRILIHGEYGTIIARDEQSVEWQYYLPAEAAKYKAQLFPILDENKNPAYCPDDLIMYSGQWRLPKGANEQDLGDLAYYRDLYVSLTENKPMPVTLEQITQQIKIVDKAFAMTGHYRQAVSK